MLTLVLVLVSLPGLLLLLTGSKDEKINIKGSVFDIVGEMIGFLDKSSGGCKLISLSNDFGPE